MGVAEFEGICISPVNCSAATNLNILGLAGFVDRPRLHIMESNPNALAFFESVMSGGFVFLNALFKKTESEENDWREYKGGEFLGEKHRAATKTEPAFEPREHMKSYWSETLSAFGNTGGGVLIWGINCPGKVPLGFSLVPKCEKWRDDLRDLVMSATDPLVGGIRLEVVFSPTVTGAGIIACYVPPSDFPPHRAEWAGKQFYIRDQDKSVVCPTGLLRNLFYPRKSARLAVSVSATVARNVQFGESLEVDVKVFNRGPATAESVVVSFHPSEPTRPMLSLESAAWVSGGYPSVKRCAWPILPQFMVPTPITLTLGGMDPLQLQINLYTHDNALQVATLSLGPEEISAMRTGTPVKRWLEGRVNDWQPHLEAGK